jgi:hypothetical protein
MVMARKEERDSSRIPCLIVLINDKVHEDLPCYAIAAFQTVLDQSIAIWMEYLSLMLVNFLLQAFRNRHEIDAITGPGEVGEGCDPDESHRH